MYIALAIMFAIAVGAAVYFYAKAAAPQTPQHRPGSGAAGILRGVLTAYTGGLAGIATNRTAGNPEAAQ